MDAILSNRREWETLSKMGEFIMRRNSSSGTQITDGAIESKPPNSNIKPEEKKTSLDNHVPRHVPCGASSHVVNDGERHVVNDGERKGRKKNKNAQDHLDSALSMHGFDCKINVGQKSNMCSVM